MLDNGKSLAARDRHIMTDWTLRDTLCTWTTKWFSLHGEHLETEDGTLLEYWRVTRADSAIALAIHQGALLLPPATYRPGIARSTLDFPGGRIGPEQTPASAARAALRRELRATPGHIAALTPLNAHGWPVDSAFSSQHLFGFVAELHDTFAPPASVARFTTDAAGLAALEQRLHCLQCRALLREWQALRGRTPPAHATRPSAE